MDGIQTHLPVEVLDQIIQYIIPDANYLAYPSSHPTTKTLVSLITVSKATSHIAKLSLYTHCLYIDTPWRLDSLLTKSLSTSNCPIPLARIDRLYISPFSGRTIRERKVVEQITELFTLLAPSLKRLIVDMPLRSHYPQEDVTEKLRPILRRGFERLVNLEEFSSVRDELFLAYRNPAFEHVADPEDDYELWKNDIMFEKWTKLRYLNVATHAGLQKLSHVNLLSTQQPDAWKFSLFVDKDKDTISSTQEWSLEGMLNGELWSLIDHAESDQVELATSV
ncbi:hypothetical protein D6C95_08897 [Aureobasidium pullulans]|nr:hypothetical protein D6C95_08897 [Aureobasidium pullulans]